MKPRYSAGLVLAACFLAFAGCVGKPAGNQIPKATVSTNFHELYSNNCAGCHGNNGMKGPGPRLNDPVYLAVVSRQDIYNVLQNGRPGTTMPAFGKSHGGELFDQQIAALADGMEQEWARPVDFKGATVPTYSVDKAPPGNAQHGQAAYQKYCMACHGYGNFKGAAGAILDPAYLALASNQWLRTVMIVGRIDWGMPNWLQRNPKSPMSDQDMSDVTAFLASKRPAYAALASPAQQPAPRAPAPQLSTGQGQAQSSEEK
jgi:cytochrome c oxidase cbb3-type subunit III